MQHDQNWAEPFLTDKSSALARHQEAVRRAHIAFKQECERVERERDAEYERASAAWDGIKSDPDAPGYDAVRKAFEASKAPADHTQARAELDRALRAADATFHEEVARIGQEHGVSVR